MFTGQKLDLKGDLYSKTEYIYNKNFIMHKLVLLRHGESQWNLENRFTGWHDVNLTEQGESEGREAGRLLKAEGFEFDVAYTSCLRVRFAPFG